MWDSVGKNRCAIDVTKADRRPRNWVQGDTYKFWKNVHVGAIKVQGFEFIQLLFILKTCRRSIIKWKNVDWVLYPQIISSFPIIWHTD